jgi:hypothetical protein
MNYKDKKYWVEDNDYLTEAEKFEFAKGLFELERQGILEYRDGLWGLAAGVEIEETPDRVVARLPKKAAVESHRAKRSTPSSGEPSETRVPPLEQAARPSSRGPGSPDSDDEVSKQ